MKLPGTTKCRALIIRDNVLLHLKPSKNRNFEAQQKLYATLRSPTSAWEVYSHPELLLLADTIRKVHATADGLSNQNTMISCKGNEENEGTGPGRIRIGSYEGQKEAFDPYRKLKPKTT